MQMAATGLDWELHNRLLPCTFPFFGVQCKIKWLHVVADSYEIATNCFPSVGPSIAKPCDPSRRRTCGPHIDTFIARHTFSMVQYLPYKAVAFCYNRPLDDHCHCHLFGSAQLPVLQSEASVCSINDFSGLKQWRIQGGGGGGGGYTLPLSPSTK